MSLGYRELLQLYRERSETPSLEPSMPRAAGPGLQQHWSGRSREGAQILGLMQDEPSGSMKVRSPSYKTLEAWSENHRIWVSGNL